MPFGGRTSSGISVVARLEAAGCPYRPGDRGVWRKVKCLNREEFVVGWTDPEGSRPHLGALLLGYSR